MKKSDLVQKLSSIEYKTFLHLITGKTYNEISVDAQVVKRVIFFRTRSICKKLGVRDRTELMSRFVVFDDEYIENSEAIVEIHKKLARLEGYLGSLLPPGEKK